MGEKPIFETRLPSGETQDISFPGGKGTPSIPGKDLKYESISSADLPRSNEDFMIVYQITEESVFYKLIIDVNSDNINLQVNIDGYDLFPGSNGFLLEDLEDLDLGVMTGEGYNAKLVGQEFGLVQYSSNRWMWIPPDPLHVASSLQVKMRSSTNHSNRDIDGGIVVRRKL